LEAGNGSRLSNFFSPYPRHSEKENPWKETQVFIGSMARKEEKNLLFKLSMNGFYEAEGIVLVYAFIKYTDALTGNICESKVEIKADRMQDVQEHIKYSPSYLGIFIQCYSFDISKRIELSTRTLSK